MSISSGHKQRFLVHHNQRIACRVDLCIVESLMPKPYKLWSLTHCELKTLRILALDVDIHMKGFSLPVNCRLEQCEQFRTDIDICKYYESDRCGVVLEASLKQSNGLLLVQ